MKINDIDKGKFKSHARQVAKDKIKTERMTKVFKRPSHRPGRVQVQASIDRDVRLYLDMHGYDVPTLIEELLVKVAMTKRCPTCGQEVRPRIVATCDEF